jgi:amino acid transporter
MHVDLEKTPTLRRNALGVLSVVTFVIATNGPLTALVGGTPAAFMLGNGQGLSGAFLAMGLMYLVFAVGFTAMGRHISNAGAFYAYVAAGLGQATGVGAAFVAITSYASLQLALYAMLGFFGSDILSSWFQVHCPWWVFAGGSITLIHTLASRNIEFNSRMLCGLMLAEVAIILAFDAGQMLVGGGPHGFDLAPLSPHAVFSHGFGSAIVFVASSYMGFETAAIYAEEAKTPGKTIPRATFVAVATIMGLYAGSTYLLTIGYGADKIVEAATKNPGTLWFDLAEQTLGGWAAQSMTVLMVTSLFAATLSFHNTISRYFYVLGREKVLWSGFGRLDATQQTPKMASAFQAFVTVCMVLACGLGGLDPMVTVMPIAATPAAIGVVAVQFLASLAVIGFFRSKARGTTVWQRLVAPLVASVCLAGSLLAMVTNVELLTGGASALNWAIPTGVLAIGAAGIAYAWRIKRIDPHRYAGLSAFLNKA